MPASEKPAQGPPWQVNLSMATQPSAADDGGLAAARWLRGGVWSIFDERGTGLRSCATDGPLMASASNVNRR
jgi:hypothetical protein